MGTLNEIAKIVRVLMYCYAPLLVLNILLGIRTEWETVSILFLTNPILVFFFIEYKKIKVFFNRGYKLFNNHNISNIKLCYH
jgi:hypothetical protein